jgi:hypothetical protein
MACYNVEIHAAYSSMPGTATLSTQSGTSSVASREEAGTACDLRFWQGNTTK